MRHETIDIFKFVELGDKAKQEAIDQYRSSSTEYSWSDEWIDSLKTFCDRLSIDLGVYSINPYSHSYINWNYTGLEGIEITDLSGLRLRTWLINNFLPNLRSFKYYSKYFNNHHKFRYSKFQYEYDNCPLTGYCGDHDLISPIIKYIDDYKDHDHSDLEDIITNCMDSFIHGCVNDMHDQDSDEYIIESIISNEYEFYKNGKQYY